MMRLNKFLASAGVCSRRKADEMIAQGLVTVDGQVATVGACVEEHQRIYVQGKEISKGNQTVLLCFHKPPGIVCTAEKREKNNIIDYIQYPQRIFPVGRLDKDSRGLILLTNDGTLSNELMRAKNAHEREYEVQINGVVTPQLLEQLSQGVYLEELDVTTRPCIVKKIRRDTFSIVLTQGLNRQIRRMCKACGRRVTDLKRVRIANLHLGDLKEGEYRPLTLKEEKRLYSMVGISKRKGEHGES